MNFRAEFDSIAMGNDDICPDAVQRLRDPLVVGHIADVALEPDMHDEARRAAEGALLPAAREPPRHRDDARQAPELGRGAQRRIGHVRPRLNFPPATTRPATLSLRNPHDP